MEQQMNNQRNLLSKRPYRWLFAPLAVALALVVCFLAHFQLIGSTLDNDKPATQYVGEVRLYQGKTVEAATNACKADGFIPVDGNLNEGTGYEAVVIGYTTTEDESAAITDVRMMQMTSGFSTVNYEELVERQFPGVASMIEDEYNLIKEFREKVSSGSFNAKTALSYLNLFDIPELGMKLGDYYISDSLDKSMLKKLFLQTAAVVTTTSYNMLAMGVSDGADDNWASRVYNYKDILDVGSDDEDGVEAGKDPFAQLDKDYLSGAEMLVDVAHDFATHYRNGMARLNAAGGDISVLSPEGLSDEEMNDHGADVLYIVAHDALNQYRFDDETALGDWLVETGSLTLGNKAELRNLYPLVAAMTFGQIVAAQMTGIQTCACYLKDLSGADKEFAESVSKAKDICREYDQTDAISVWSGVDQKMFEQECAVTGDAQRYTNLKDTAANLVKRNRAIQVLEAISDLTSFGLKIAGGFIAAMELPLLVAGWFETIALYCCQHWTLGFIFCALGRVAFYFGLVSKIALVVVLIIMVVVFLYDLLKPECDDLTYTSIPTVTMDMIIDNNVPEKNGLLRYDLIHSPDGKADLNAYEGKQWNALYSTQNTEAGRRITVADGKAPFIVQKNNAENPAGYKAVKNFNELYSANLNANVRKDSAPAIYLFCASEGEIAGTAEVEETAAPQAGTASESAGTQQNYVASVYLSSDNSETIAKNNLTQQGYHVVDVNLSPHVTHPDSKGIKQIKAYAYLGYTTTTNPNAAVTDIRMAKIKSTNQALLYGTVKYTAAGFDSFGNSICYSKDPLAGSPILADDIQVTDSLSERKAGYEPVAYLAGPAYNFDACEDFDKWDSSKYVFFSPSEKFTSGTEYISGLYFVSGLNVKEGNHSLTAYAETLGGRLLGDADFTKGRDYSLPQTGHFSPENIKTYLCYTTTFNPKRALYDVQFYAGTPSAKFFMTTLTAYTGYMESNYAQTGYGITNVFMQGEKTLARYLQYQTDPSKDGRSLLHFEVNNYDDFTVSSGEKLDPRVVDCSDNYVDNVIPGVSWKYVLSQPRLLFGCGYKKGYTPLTPQDLVLTGEKGPEGYASVQDVKFPYETKPLNLAYFYSEKSSACSTVYLYINRPAPVRGKYIASIRTGIYVPEKKWEELEREANDTLSNETCYIPLVGSSMEIINQSLARMPGNAWYDRTIRDPYNKDLSVGSIDADAEAAYLGVTYTDNPAKAIHGLLRLEAQDGVKPSETLTVNGAKYTLVECVTSKEPVPITSPNGKQFYLYATFSSGGSSTGDPITEIQVSDKIFEPGMSTMLTVTGGDKEAQKDFYGNVTAPAEYAIPFGDTSESLYYHLKTNATLTGIDSFFVGTGDSEMAAMKDLLTQGATVCLPLNLNAGAPTDAHVYIGYHHYNPDYVNTRRTKYYMESAVKDLYVYVGENPEKRLTIDKRKYTLCSDRDLNYGTGGTPMYLYQSTALINDKDKANASYITAVSAAQFDRVPADIAENKWENLLTTEKQRIDLNAGVLAFDREDASQHLIDARVFVFVHRNDNYVKPEAVITGGYTTETTVFGDVVLNKAS